MGSPFISMLSISFQSQQDTQIAFFERKKEEIQRGGSSSTRGVEEEEEEGNSSCILYFNSLLNPFKGLSLKKGNQLGISCISDAIVVFLPDYARYCSLCYVISKSPLLESLKRERREVNCLFLSYSSSRRKRDSLESKFWCFVYNEEGVFPNA